MKTTLFKLMLPAVLLLAGCTKSSFNTTTTPTAGSSSSQSLNSNSVGKIYSDSSFDNSQMAAGTFAVIPDNKIYNFGTLAVAQAATKPLSIKLVRDPKSSDSVSMASSSAFSMITQKTINNDIYFMITPKAQAVGNYSESAFLNVGGKKIPIILRVNIVPAVVPKLNCAFNDKTIMHGSVALAYQSGTVAYGSSCVSENRLCNNGVLAGTYTSASCSVSAASGCNFGGQALANGGMVSAYESATVAYGTTCKKETRTCANGVLSGSYTSSACSVVAAASCAFDGKTYASGTSVLAYPVASVPYGTSCVSETRSCANGVLSGKNTFSNCIVAGPAACSFDNKPVSSGSSVTAYETAMVPYGSVCKKETRTCANGVLSGSLLATACVVADAASCTFDGKPVSNGASVQAYTVASVPYGSQCKVENRTCNNGVLSGSNTFAVCTVAPANGCTFDNKPLANGATVQAYTTATVPYGSQCKVETRTCNNGDLSGSNTFASCTVDPVAACTFDNKPVANSASVTAFEAATVPYGQTCKSQLRSCSNGVLSGSYAAATCTPAAAVSCMLEDRPVANNASIWAYEAKTVPYGQTCRSQLRSCSNGVLSGAYTSATCTVDAAVACTFDNKPVANNAYVWAYQAATVPYGSTCSQQMRTCSNGTLSGTYTAAACVVSQPTYGATELSYNKNFYDPTVSETTYGVLSESDSIDLGEVPSAETDSQVLQIKIKNGNPSALSVGSSGLINASVDGMVYSIAANQEAIIKLKPAKSEVGSYNNVWKLVLGPKTYTIKVKLRIVP